MSTPNVNSADEEIRSFAREVQKGKMIVHIHLANAGPDDLNLATVRFDMNGDPVMRSKFTGEYPSRSVT